MESLSGVCCSLGALFNLGCFFFHFCYCFYDDCVFGD